jgi:Xaa-Pro aminopeptidase
MPDFVFYGDTERSYAMRHELPLSIGDPFLLAVIDGRLHVEVNLLERERVAAVAPDAALYDISDFGLKDLRERGLRFDEIRVELASRIAAAMGLRDAVADPELPVTIADRLRADGITLQPDHLAVAARRRAKSPAELEGIRRAQSAAEAGMAAAAALIGGAVPDGERLRVDGEVLTAEAVRHVIREACARMGAPAPPDIIVGSVWQGFGHEPGSGPLPADLPIQIDLWPRDETSGCWADMTRTFLVGDPPEQVREQERLVRAALEQARESVRPGVRGRELYAKTCDLFEAAGYRTQRTGPGDDRNEGFQFSLGHGVGLAVHEDPGLGLTGHDPLIPGDVVAIEPGLWDRHIGGVRFEDLLLVTEDGNETLTRYPYELSP